MDELIEWLRAQLDATDVECEGAAEYGDCHDLSELRHRDVEAKRRIIDVYGRHAADWAAHPEEADREYRVMRAEMSALELTLRLLAETYADRPGYKEAWRP